MGNMVIETPDEAKPIIELVASTMGAILKVFQIFRVKNGCREDGYCLCLLSSFIMSFQELYIQNDNNF